MLAKPQTYMNLSGTSLAPLMEKHSIPVDRLVVVYDELDLPWLSLRIKPNGFGGRSQRHEVGDRQFGDQRSGSSAYGDSSGPSESRAARILCWRRSSARKKRNWRNSSTSQPTRFAP